jgi:hypothetical protein
VLDSEFSSTSNGAVPDTCCPVESMSFIPNTGFKAGFSRYILLTFAHEPVLALYLIVLGVEFDPVSNGAFIDSSIVYIYLLLIVSNSKDSAV